jgi:multiple antibiotic resistance protein
MHLVFVGFVSLFPPVNPPGSALKIAIYAFLICTFTIFVGSWIFKFFGISLPVVQLAGGILICKMAWSLLSFDDTGKGAQETAEPENASKNIEDILSFPMTTGAGTIAVLLTLSAHDHDNELALYLTHFAALVAAIILMCLLIYFCYSFTPALIKNLGPRGSQVLNRLSAFLVFCVGIQIASDGLTQIMKG